MEKNTDQFAGHLQDLAEQSYTRQIYTFTNFLGDAEQGVLESLRHELNYAGITLNGGTEYAQRCVARFGNPEELGYEQPFPISLLKAIPVSEKFSESLTHRDCLGAIMGLGIERNLIGDIYLEGQTVYFFCLERIEDYLMQHLRQIRHTYVTLSKMESIPDHVGPKMEERVIIAASGRLDAVVSQVFHLSRSLSLVLLQHEKVLVNGRTCQNGSRTCKQGDRISVRGYGKFLYDGVEGTTGKGRCRIKVKIYR